MEPITLPLILLCSYTGGFALVVSQTFPISNDTPITLGLLVGGVCAVAGGGYWLGRQIQGFGDRMSGFSHRMDTMEKSIASLPCKSKSECPDK